MKLKPSKCEYFKCRIAYLGHIVSDKGIETDPKKIEAIVDWPIPKTVHDVCSFLGFTNYYQKFIYKYAQKAKPLNILISGENAKKKHSKVDWTDDGQAAFDLLKETCTNPTVLAYTNYKKPFRLNMDASKKVWELFFINNKIMEHTESLLMLVELCPNQREIMMSTSKSF